jgi:hypothetical protein
MRRFPLVALPLAGLSLGCLSIALAAQEYCISCTEPQALYRCVITDARPNDAQPLQMLCITTLAKQGGHATCAVRRGTVFDCDAPIKRVSATGNAPAADTPPVPGNAPKQEGPARTVEQLAKQIAKSSSDQAGKAGESVSNTARKAWTCLTSFFKSC